MSIENGDKLNLHPQDGRVARPVAVVGNKQDLEGQVDIMTAMLEQMLKAGAQAGPLVAHYNKDRQVIISPADNKTEK